MVNSKRENPIVIGSIQREEGGVRKHGHHHYGGDIGQGLVGWSICNDQSRLW